MKKILLIDSDIYSEWCHKSALLSRYLEFMDKYKDSTNKVILEEIKNNCNPEKLWELQEEMLNLEKSWYKGEIIL